mgnify:CR=1 FL=1
MFRSKKTSKENTKNWNQSFIQELEKIQNKDNYLIAVEKVREKYQDKYIEVKEYEKFLSKIAKIKMLILTKK